VLLDLGRKQDGKQSTAQIAERPMRFVIPPDLKPHRSTPPMP
jgi:hypothetical protein